MRHLLPLLVALACASGCDSPPVGHPPIALLVAPTSCDLGSTITLDGSGSTDPDRDIILYHFVIADGSPERLETVPTIEHTCRLAGLIEAALEVEDAEGHASWSTALISVRRP
jgi:hypothetical protein